MNPLVHDVGMDEYPIVKAAQERAKMLLEELADVKAQIQGHRLGAEWLRLENEKEFDATQKAVDDALEDRLAITCSESAKMYGLLAKTPLYDKARGQWNWGMSETQIIPKSPKITLII